MGGVRKDDAKFLAPGDILTDRLWGKDTTNQNLFAYEVVKTIQEGVVLKKVGIFKPFSDLERGWDHQNKKPLPIGWEQIVVDGKPLYQYYVKRNGKKVPSGKRNTRPTEDDKKPDKGLGKRLRLAAERVPSRVNRRPGWKPSDDIPRRQF